MEVGKRRSNLRPEGQGLPQADGLRRGGTSKFTREAEALFEISALEALQNEGAHWASRPVLEVHDPEQRHHVRMR